MKFSPKSFIAGVFVTVILSAGLAYAASGTRSIEVTYRDIKLYIDGVLLTPKDPNGVVVEPFIYNGTTYLPIRAVGEAFGKDVAWDGETSSIYIGGRPGAPNITARLYKMPYMEVGDAGAFTMVGDDENNYIRMHFDKLDTYDFTVNQSDEHNNYVVFAINATANKFKATLNPPNDFTMINSGLNAAKQTISYNIYGDNRLIYTSPELGAGSLPIPIEIDVTGVIQLRIESSLRLTGDGQFQVDDTFKGIENAVLITN